MEQQRVQDQSFFAQLIQSFKNLSLCCNTVGAESLKNYRHSNMLSIINSGNKKQIESHRQLRKKESLSTATIAVRHRSRSKHDQQQQQIKSMSLKQKSTYLQFHSNSQGSSFPLASTNNQEDQSCSLNNSSNIQIESLSQSGFHKYQTQRSQLFNLQSPIISQNDINPDVITFNQDSAAIKGGKQGYPSFQQRLSISNSQQNIGKMSLFNKQQLIKQDQQSLYEKCTMNYRQNRNACEDVQINPNMFTQPNSSQSTIQYLKNNQQPQTTTSKQNSQYGKYFNFQTYKPIASNNTQPHTFKANHYQKNVPVQANHQKSGHNLNSCALSSQFEIIEEQHDQESISFLISSFGGPQNQSHVNQNGNLTQVTCTHGSPIVMRGVNEVSEVISEAIGHQTISKKNLKLAVNFIESFQEIAIFVLKPLAQFKKTLKFESINFQEQDTKIFNQDDEMLKFNKLNLDQSLNEDETLRRQYSVQNFEQESQKSTINEIIHQKQIPQTKQKMQIAEFELDHYQNLQMNSDHIQTIIHSGIPKSSSDVLSLTQSLSKNQELLHQSLKRQNEDKYFSNKQQQNVISEQFKRKISSNTFYEVDEEGGI
eukprot:403355034